MSNDYWRSLYGGSSPKEFSATTLVKSINAPRGVEVDVGKYIASTNGLSAATQVNTGYFINVASAGLTGKAAKRLAASNSKGKLSNCWNILRAASQRTSYLVRVRVGEQDLGTFDSLLVAVCQGKYFGHKLNIAPNAQVNDGKFTLVILRNVGLFYLTTGLLRKLRNGTIQADADHVVMLETDEKIVIEPVSQCHPILVAGDGEQLVGELPCTFEQSGLKVQMLAHQLF
jgi:diacylglycerol kinase family enzyme